MPSTVVLADDHPIVLQGLQHLLDTSGSYRVVGVAKTGEETLQLVRGQRPALLVLDMRLTDMLAPEVCAAVKRDSPGTAVVILTAFDDGALLRSCWDAGANAILMKDEADILGALDAVSRGERVVAPKARELIDRVTVGEGEERRGPLSPREYQVLCLLAEGMTSRQIAESLHLGLHTVRSYVDSILTKLSARSRAQAVNVARRLNLL